MASAAGSLAPLGAGAAESAGTPTCLGKPATIVRGAGSQHVRGGPKNDVIVTGGGNDVIDGRGGNDRICSGPGNDKVDGGMGGDSVMAGAGDDVVDGNLGTDHIDLSAGDDRALGDRGNDEITGGAGKDTLSGELGDDILNGEEGTDQLLGGLGQDKLRGGPGDRDLLRGDRGGDKLSGGPGAHDVASYSTASTRGSYGAIVISQAADGHSLFHSVFGFTSGVPTGVSVDLGGGTATADSGGRDTIKGVEDVIGSAYADGIVGDSGPNVIDGGGGNDALFGIVPDGGGNSFHNGIPDIVPAAGRTGDVALGGAGNDVCFSFTSLESCNETSGSQPGIRPPSALASQVTLNPGVDGTSLIIAGTQAANDIDVRPGGGGYVVTDPRGIAPGDGCSLQADGSALCPAPAGIDTIVISGGTNDDQMEIDDTVPASVTARLKGEDGNDTLIGGSGDDILEGGEGFGFDVLRGRGGNDALTSSPGTDVLEGGPGSDLLIDEATCEDHSLSGGPGIDSVSFARSPGLVTAHIGGKVTVDTTHSLFPFPFTLCEVPDQVSPDVEGFEGSKQDDKLYGNGDDNRLLGRAGDDLLYGGGGSDRIVGGSGSDALSGGSGSDHLFSKDNSDDAGVDCGSGPGPEQVVADPNDHVKANCR